MGEAWTIPHHEPRGTIDREMMAYRHKVIRCNGKSRITAISADLSAQMIAGQLSEPAVRTTIDGIADGFREMVFALLTYSEAMDLFLRLVDDLALTQCPEGPGAGEPQDG